MDSVAKIIDETGLSIYETKNLLESLHTVLECSSLNNQNTHLRFYFPSLRKTGLKTLNNLFLHLKIKYIDNFY